MNKSSYNYIAKLGRFLRLLKVGKTVEPAKIRTFVASASLIVSSLTSDKIATSDGD